MNTFSPFVARFARVPRILCSAAVAMLLTASCATFSKKAMAIDLVQVERELTTTGITGEVHGASRENGIFVFTYRNPDDFFDFVQMSLVTGDPAIEAQLTKLNRHDRVKVKGSFMDNASPQKHILIESLEVVKKYEPPVAMPGYEHEAQVPEELLSKKSASFLVHAIHSDGHILVVEYKDVVLPIWVKDGALTKDLFRGDVVRLSYRVQRYPGQPVHLRVNETEAGAVTVVEAIREKHGKKGTIEGALILFPKSPEIVFNVFAVQENLADGLSRQYTLVNFEDQEVFAKIRAHLQAAWDRHPGAYVNGRNKLVSTKVRVRASGTFNDIHPNQANPQILLEGVESVEILDQR